MTARHALAVATVIVCTGGCGSGSETGPAGPGRDPPAIIASLEMEVASLGLGVGEPAMLRVVARDSAGHVIQAPALSWASQAPAVATVVDQGSGQAVVTGVSHGQAAIEVLGGSRVAAALVTVTRAGPAPTRVWTEIALPFTQAFLWDVWGASGADLWLVGDSARAFRFDGISWTDRSPKLGIGAFLTVAGMGGSLWAAGGNVDGSGEIARYRGGVWTKEDVGTDRGLVRGLWAAAERDVWAVGSLKGGAGVALRFDGLSWRVETLPAGTPELRSVWGDGPRSVWLVGAKGTVLHYDGQRVTQEAAGLTSERLEDVWGDGRGNVWVVGLGGTVLAKGTTGWSDVSPGIREDDPLGNNLFAVWGTGASDVWSVGRGGLLIHFDGSAWSGIDGVTPATMPGMGGAGGVIIAAGGFRGHVVVGADPAAFPPPGSSVREILPGSQAPDNVVTLTGQGFPVGWGAKYVRLAQGDAGALGFTFPTPDLSTEILWRLPADASQGTARVQVVNGVGAAITSPVDFEVRAVPAAPVVIEVLEATLAPDQPCNAVLSPQSTGGILHLGDRQAVAVRGHGLDTAGGWLRLAQGDATWTFRPVCTSIDSNGGGVRLLAPLPAVAATSDRGTVGLAAGEARLSVRQHDGEWSLATDVMLVVGSP